jgi:acetyl-CoA carboxylase, biotin carboxylase subunit
MSIPIYYDPMIAKLVVHAPDRMSAIERMKRAIADYKIVGFANTLEFGTFVLNHQAFVSGKFNTNFIAKYFQASDLEQINNAVEMEIAAIIASNMAYERSTGQNVQTESISNISAWRINRT